MGGGMRRLREGFRSTFHLQGKLLQPTKIDR